MRGTSDDGPPGAEYCPPRYEWSSELCACRPTWLCPVLCEIGLEPHPLNCGECVSPEDLNAFLDEAQQRCSPPEAYADIVCADGTVISCLVDDPLCRDRSPLYCKDNLGPVLGGPTLITCPDGSEVECPSGTLDCRDDSPVYCTEPALILCDHGPPVECNGLDPACTENSATLCPPPSPETLAGLDENCQGFDETTGGPFPECEPGLTCIDVGGISIPGAENRCVLELIVGGLRAIKCPDGSIAECNEGTQHCYDESPVHCPAGLGANCLGFDETTGLPFPDCAAGLVCRDQGGASIPGAGLRCEPELDGAPIEILCEATNTVALCSPHPDCYDNSPAFCPIPLPPLLIKEIECPDGVTAACPDDDGLCFDGSPEYCPDVSLPGGPITITCSDGREITCPSGTQQCYSGSPFYCGPEIVGAEIRISCSDGSATTCNAGTRDCYSGSELYCPLVFSGLGETCEGFNEITGLPFPSCEGDLVCAEGDGVSIPGANSRCVEAPIVGAETEITCDNGPNAFCSPSPDCYDNSPVFCLETVGGPATGDDSDCDGLYDDVQVTNLWNF